MSVLFSPLGGLAAPVPPAQQWLTQLIEEANRSRKIATQQPSTLEKLKGSFAIETMSTQAYGQAFLALKPEARKTYLQLMETFFEKSVIKALFHAKAGEEKVTYKVFQIKTPQASECASKIMGTIDHEQRVDWTIHKAQASQEADEEVYETKFCIRNKSKSGYEIVDIVVEGVSWVQDLADEIQRFYQEAKAGDNKSSSEHIHDMLIQKLKDRVEKL